jgi:hypothetical protein
MCIILINDKTEAQSKISAQDSLVNTPISDSVELRNSKKIPYQGETRIVKKAGQRQLKANQKTTESKNEISDKNNFQTKIVQAKINPISNLNIQTTDTKVLNKMQLNKESGKDIFQGICLVYKIQTGLDSDKTNYESLLNVWKKEKMFVQLKQLDSQIYLLFLDAYFDTEITEEMMINNKLKVIFKEEYYTLTPLEK